MLYLPYTPEKLHPETRMFGNRHGAVFVDVSLDVYDYARAFFEWWEDRQTFTILEHDIIPTDDDLAEMLSCDRPWCAASYSYPGRADLIAFGFTTFRAPLVGRKLQTLGKFQMPRWWELDGFVAQALHIERIHAHPHPKVLHMGDGSR